MSNEPKEHSSGFMAQDRTKVDLIYRQAAIDVLKVFTQKDALGFTPKQIVEALPSAQLEPSEITDDQAILHLQSTGWMQNHDREMYESGLKEQLTDDSGSYDILIPCEDTISRQDAIDALDAGLWGVEWDKALATAMLKDLPSAQPTIDPVRRGRWVKLDIHPHLADHKCTACGESAYVPTCMGEPIYLFCPNCGARMEVEK